MFEFINFNETIIWFFQVQIQYFNLIIHRFCVIASNSQMELIIFFISKCNCVILKITFIGINLFSMTILRKYIDFVFYFIIPT